MGNQEDHNTAVMQIRPHHLMCLAYFEGKGYSEGFTRHMAEVKDSLETEGGKIVLTCTTDEICRQCPNREGNLCSSGDKVLRYDRAVLSELRLQEGAGLPYHEIREMVERKILRTGVRKRICGSCEWDAVCSSKVRFVQFHIR